MKKYFIVALLSTLLLASCTKKEEKIDTWTLDDKKVVVDNKDVNTSTWNVEDTTNTGSKMDTDVSMDSSTEKLVEKDGVYTFTDNAKGYQISFKKSDDYTHQEGQPGAEVLVANKKNGSSVSVLTEDYSMAPNLDTLEDYLKLSVENVKKAFNLSEIKTEATELNWQKGFKIMYSLTNSGITVDITQYLFGSDNELAYIVTKWVVAWGEWSNEMQEIVDSFKLLK